MLDAAVEIVAELGRILRRNPRLRRLVRVLAALVLGLVLWTGVRWVLRPGVAVSGRVTFEGQPLDRGVISFHEKDGGTGLPVAGAEIEDGRYAVAVDGGLVSGKYVVQIRSPEPGPLGENGAAPPAQERIPAAFNDGSRLIIEVSRFGRNRFDFSIP